MSKTTWLLGAALCAQSLSIIWISKSLAAGPKATKQTQATSQLGAGRGKAVTYALRHNPTLRLIRARWRGAVARRGGVDAFPNNPTLSAGGGAQIPVPQAGQGGAGVLPRASASLSLALPVGGRWGRAQEQAKLQARWRKRAFGLRQFQLQLQVHRGINETIFAWRQWRQRLAMASYFQRVEALTKQRIKHGSAKLVELSFVQASRLQAQQAVLAAALGWRTARQRLQQRLGWTSAARAMPWRWVQFPALPGLPTAAALQKQLSSHPMTRVAQASVAMAKAGLRLSQAQAVPDLTVSVGYALEDNQHVVQGALSIPLPLFWRGQSDIATSRARWRQAKIALTRVRFRLRQRLQRALTRLRAQRKMGALLRRRARALQARSKMLERGLRQGGFSVFQVLTTQRSILQSRLLQLDNTRQIHRSYLALCLAAGRLPGYVPGGAP